MQVRTLNPIQIQTRDGHRDLAAGSIGEFVRVVRDDVYGDDIVVLFDTDTNPNVGELRIPAEDLEPVQ